MCDIHDAHAGFLAFVREVKDAAAIGPLLDSETLATVAIACKIVVTDERHVV